MDAPRSWPGPAVELVELPGRSRRLALVGPTGGRAPDLPDVPGLLHPESVDAGRAVWGVADHIPVVALLGAPAPGAAVELFCLAAEVLCAAERAGAGPHGGPDPWRLLVRRDGQVAVIGYGLSRPEWRGAGAASVRAWAAPELPGDGPSSASDLWALAAAAAALGSGDLPASAVEPASRTRGLGRGLSALLHRCLDVRAGARPDWSTALETGLALLDARRPADGSLAARFEEVMGPPRSALADRLLARAAPPEAARMRASGEDRHGLRARLTRSEVPRDVVADAPQVAPPASAPGTGDPPSSPGSLLLARLRGQARPTGPVFEYGGAALPLQPAPQEAVGDFALRAATALCLLATDLDGRLASGFQFCDRDGPIDPSTPAAAVEGPVRLTAVPAGTVRVDVRAGRARASLRLPAHVPVGWLVQEVAATLGGAGSGLSRGGRLLPSGAVLHGLDLSAGLDLLP